MNPITFVFLLTTYTAETPNAHSTVEDYALTASDCTAAVLEYDARNPQWTDGTPSCEIDTGDWTPHPYDEFAVCATDACPNPIILSPCVYEDSDDCFWDSRFMGNGTGDSFYVIDGVRNPIEWN